MDGRVLLQEVRSKPIELTPGRMVISVSPGEWTSPFEGKGYEPYGYRDFVIGENPRRIHLPTSARRGAPTIVERVALRDYKLMVVVDTSPSMSARNKHVIQLQVATLLLYAAWQAETTFSLAVRSDTGVRSYGAGIGSRHFYNLYRILWTLLDNADGRPIKGGSPLHLSRCLPPNAMLIICSDFLEPDGEITDIRNLMISVARYDLIPIIIQDEMEHSFPVSDRGSLIPFRNPETGVRDELWLSEKAAREVRALHQCRFAKLKEQFAQRGVRPIHLSSPGVSEIRKTVDQFFRRRKRKT